MSTVKAQHKPKLSPKGTKGRSSKPRTVKPAKDGAKHIARLTPMRTPKAKHPCVCGCGSETARVFAQGHDAKVYAILRRVRDGEAKSEDVPAGVRNDEALLDHMLSKVN